LRGEASLVPEERGVFASLNVEKICFCRRRCARRPSAGGDLHAVSNLKERLTSRHTSSRAGTADARDRPDLRTGARLLCWTADRGTAPVIVQQSDARSRN
jgi:hypothetical protein